MPSDGRNVSPGKFCYIVQPKVLYISDAKQKALNKVYDA